MKPNPVGYDRKSSPSKAYPDPKPFSRQTITTAIITIAIVSTIIFFQTPTRPDVQDLGLFRQPPSHKPPVQKNSTSGEVRWHSDWKWLKPFSASITRDEDRSVLPPLNTRLPIYTFYDSEEKKDEKVRAAENRLLLTWRRAWWAQGFRPVVLGRSEATKHPEYEKLRGKGLQSQIELDMVRWLAWAQMGTGVLANWLVYPMSARQEPLLSSLRKGEYSALTRYEGLGSGLFSGEKSAIDKAIVEALSSSNLKDSKSILDALPRETLTVHPAPSEIAFYDARTNAEHYQSVTASLGENKAEGLESLATLINSHLHLTFISTFSDGIAILNPFSKPAGILTQRARALAEALRACPASPIPPSCPPNRQNCHPCSSSAPLAITNPEQYTNSSTVFTIGPVPHPYTLASLKGKTKDITTRHIRRDTDRDPWLEAITVTTLGDKLGGQGRIVPFKEMVAHDWDNAQGIWLADSQPLKDRFFEYHFGFSLPPLNTTASPNPDDYTFVSQDRKEASRSLKLQQSLLDAAQVVVQTTRKTTSASGKKKKNSKKGDKSGVREMVEAWNLADTEAWRFVRAFAARERVEQINWEQEERKFAGGDREHGEGSWRWFDRM